MQHAARDMTASFNPREIQIRGENELFISWDDGHESAYPLSYLRKLCPCAMCTDEWTGASKLDPASIPDNLKTEKTELVGNYAISFQFSDGHSTGIFSFENLRKTCPCAACRQP